jgi:hypothetical protein
MIFFLQTLEDSWFLKSADVILAGHSVAFDWEGRGTTEKGVGQNKESVLASQTQIPVSHAIGRDHYLSSYDEGKNKTPNLCTRKDFIDITATEYTEYPPPDIPVIKTDWRKYRNESHCAVRGNYLANEENLKRVQTIFSKGNFQLLPKRVLNGECQLPRSYINLDHQSPFPDNAIVLFVGNSHLNQLVTSLLCRYDDVILTRRGCDDQCDFDTLNLTKCWGEAGVDQVRNSHFIHGVFPNGA